MRNKQTIIWIGALILGVGLGLLNLDWLNQTMTVIAKIFARLFQLLAIPTIAVAITATMMTMGADKSMSRIFRKTVQYTIVTTIVASIVGVTIYYLIAPSNLSAAFVDNGDSTVAQNLQGSSYFDLLLDAIPDNIVKPIVAGNVLGVLILAFAGGIGISCLPDSDKKTTLKNFILGVQDLLFLLIKWLVAVLPIGIVAFAAQLTTQVSGGVVAASLGKYTLVVLAANFSQIFIVLPLFLLAHKINPIKAISRMSPAILTAFFTKSSAATLPLTISTAETKMGVSPKISRFVLPICTTVNMNGCAAFIAITSIFVMQNAGIDLSFGQIVVWILISVISAIGNAGVPMGCYFLTVSLMSDVTGAMAIMGVILPIYTIIDMVETAENVWSDSTVAIACDDVLCRRRKLCED